MTQTPPPDAGSYHYAPAGDAFLVPLHEPPGDALKKVPEALVQDLWQQQRFDRAELQTTDDRSLHVLDPGAPNTDAGPDFTNARLRIGDTEWAGAVEIHVASSGWFEHRHHTDARYNNVVLHVVLHADMWTGGLLHEDDSALPELVLFPHLQVPLRKLLHDHCTSQDDDILCASRWNDAPDDLKENHITELGRERLRSKRERLARQYEETPDLAELLHRRLFAGLGYAKNDEPMTRLAERLPLDLVRQLDDLFDLEALHLGAAGLLPAPDDLLETDRSTADYAVALRDRFRRLNAALEVPVMRRESWKFFRLRPANFPPLRIAQAAALVAPGGLLRENDAVDLLAEAIQQKRPKRALREMLSAEASAFWETHVRLTKATKPRSPALGRTRTDQMLTNAVAPVLLLRAEQTGNAALREAVLALVKDLPARRDSVTRRYRALGTKADDTLQAQGQHQLFRTRCQEARCLTCPIGEHLLERT
jgi:hypothetical protein